MHRMAQVSRWLRRRLCFATTAAFLRPRVPSAYAISSIEISLLPNPLSLSGTGVPKTERPSVLFLARMDPVKRPWLFVELARAFPEADFLMVGQNHFTGPGSWQPSGLPANVRMLGHVAGEEKRRVIASSWVLVNTSVHEGLPVSVLEALACAVPLLSTLDPEAIASRFGVFAGRHEGDGHAALPALREGLRRLLYDPAERRRLGEAGRDWVRRTHNPEAFSTSFHELARRAGRPLPDVQTGA